LDETTIHKQKDREFVLLDENNNPKKTKNKRPRVYDFWMKNNKQKDLC
jgi:hypothetical protein